jgi:hypothetical protein
VLTCMFRPRLDVLRRRVESSARSTAATFFPTRPTHDEVPCGNRVFHLRAGPPEITKVAACIYLKARSQPVVHAGFMSLTGPQYWGPDLSVTPDVCAA